MVLGCSATTELSSFTASSTTSLLGDFLRSMMAVLKSFSFFTAGGLSSRGGGRAQLRTGEFLLAHRSIQARNRPLHEAVSVSQAATHSPCRGAGCSISHGAAGAVVAKQALTRAEAENSCVMCLIVSV